MATCPKGHESATTDYCDQCGTPMAGAPAAWPGSAAPSSVSAAGPAGSSSGTASAASGSAGAGGEPCPICGTPRNGRFCEEDGYDFLLAPPVGDAASAGGAAGDAVVGDDAAGAGSTAPALVVAVDVDRAYFDVMVGMGGEDAGVLSFPRFVVERRFPLGGQQLLIGRASRSRGIAPDIDLSGPPEDPGVSHAHALLVPQPDAWAVVDLGSANGTYLNDPRSAPIPAETPVPVKPGDRIFVGAWTCLSIRRAD